MTYDETHWAGVARCRSAEELASQVRTVIAQESFGPGDRLPTVRELANQSGLAHSEAYRALVTLAAEGWVVQKRGSGTYVGPKKAQLAKKKNSAPAKERSARRMGVIPPGWDPGATHELVGGILQGIGMLAAARGYRVEVISASGTEYMTPAFAERVLSLDLDGVIWVQPAYELPMALIRLIETRLPLVLTGRGFAGLEVPTILMDNAWIGESIARFMERYGRTQLVALVGCRDDLFTASQVEGIREALGKRGMELPDDKLFTVRTGHVNRFYSHDVLDGARRFLERQEGFDAVYSLYPEALEPLFELHRSGRRRCPQDHLHVHFGRASMPLDLPWHDIPISFLEPAREVAGREAIRALERLWGVAHEDENEIARPTLVEDHRLEALLNQRIIA